MAMKAIFLDLDGTLNNDQKIITDKTRAVLMAVQIGDASKVVPVDKLSVVLTLILAFVFLHEKFTPKSLNGCVLIAAGTLIMVL